MENIFNIQTLKLKTNQLRRRIAKSIKPNNFDPDPFWDVPINIGLKYSEQLRKQLTIDDKTFILIAGPTQADPRSYVVYSSINEVIKSSMQLLRLQEFFQDFKVDLNKNRINRLISTYIIEEQETRIRKLLEVLLLLILFNSTNEENYYRHYLMLEEFESSLSTNLDLEEFYEAKSQNVGYMTDLFKKSIQDLENKLDLQRCWYLKDKRSIVDRNNRPGIIFRSIRQRIKLALEHMTSLEKIIFGLSYRGTYGRASSSIHFRMDKTDVLYNSNNERSNIYCTGFLNSLILQRCHELIGAPELPIAKQVYESLNKIETKKLFNDIAVRDINIRDIVLANGELAEVIDIKESTFGYKSYNIRYLAEKPIPEIQEDWFPAMYVQRFYTRERFDESLIRMIKEGKISPDTEAMFGKLKEEELHDILKNSITELWKLGFRDWVRSQKRKKE